MFFAVWGNLLYHFDILLNLSFVNLALCFVKRNIFVAISATCIYSGVKLIGAIMNPASKVLKKFGDGGISMIAKELKINRSTVSRWATSREDGGTDGIIPAKYHKPLLKLAAKKSIPLTAGDLVGV